MLLDCKQCGKIINEWFLHYELMLVYYLLASKMALMT